jgi:SsrA-binding protein
MFPSPTAEPMTASTKANREDQWPCNEVLRAGVATVSAIPFPTVRKLASLKELLIANNNAWPEIMALKQKNSKATHRTIAENRKARHDFFIEESIEAGIALEGWEVKSLRAGRANLTEAYAILKGGEAWLVGAHIAPLTSASTHVHPDPIRTRKLLLHRRELDRLIGSVERKGYTLVPLSLYWQRGRTKLQVGLAKGKKQHDKRAAEKDRDWKRQKERILKK